MQAAVGHSGDPSPRWQGGAQSVAEHAQIDAFRAVLGGLDHASLCCSAGATLVAYKQLPPLVANSRGSDARDSQHAKFQVLPKDSTQFRCVMAKPSGLLGYIWGLI